ncbi:HAMP domain-containing sensor histidine kinase [uncultured Mucilaginibacter sp.]|uniref:sensor histidine kinase n=1 Tax=uncultured Mucilaginibacter sp. TaxID=797541 RepID=UPI0025F067C7|nr:HAMP domain-containing sensor histidine kinase [uncultured Mucilaginibacter sp.]
MQKLKDETPQIHELFDQLKLSYRNLNAAFKREKETNKMKSHFFAMASHEFRSPLTSIQLSASLVERYYDKMDEQKRTFHLRKIQTAVTDMTAILNDFLSAEGLENGNMAPVFQEFDLVTFCEDAAQEMQWAAKPQQKILYRHMGKITRVLLDKNFLKHCIVNLISNAIKYSHETGIIWIETAMSERSCVIRIRDKGIGIPKECQDHIFTPFFRATNTADISGTGLGLNIVKHYVNLMNGKIRFTSAINTGTTFTIVFRV